MEAVRALVEEGKGLDAAALEALTGKPAIYHCLSRVVDRQRVLGPVEREMFTMLMRRYELFCQVRVLTHSVMSNHFHILLEVPAPPPQRGRDWSDQRLLAHLGCLYSKEKVAAVGERLAEFRARGDDGAAEELRESYFRRMWDLSECMKGIKQGFTQWFNSTHDRVGTLWEGRFKSLLAEDGHAAQVLAAYIDLNPVRAGIVQDPKDYRWCGYAEALAGHRRAREGIQRVMYESGTDAAGRGGPTELLTDWKEAVGRYRQVIAQTRERDEAKQAAIPAAGGGPGAAAGRAVGGPGAVGGRAVGGPGAVGGRAPGRRATASGRGATPTPGAGRTGAVGGRPGGREARRITEREAVRQRVRYFADGLVLGSADFVNQIFRWTRGHFGPRRKDGARRLRGIQTDLRAMRDLQKL